MKNSNSNYFLPTLKSLYFFKHFNKKLIFLFLILIKLSEFNSQIFQTLPPNILSQDSTLYEIKNNENKNIILTSKEIFSGLEPKKLGNLENEFRENTEFTTYDSNYMLAVCTNNHLLIQFNINSQEKKILYNYEDLKLSLTTSVCSISYFDSYAYIIHTSIDEDGAYVKYTLIKINLINSEDGPIKGDYFKKYYKTESLFTPKNFKFISCEAIKAIDSSNSSLICTNIYIISNKYYYIFITINFELGQIDDQRTIGNSQVLVNFKIQRVNDTFARYIIFNRISIF